MKTELSANARAFTIAAILLIVAVSSAAGGYFYGRYEKLNAEITQMKDTLDNVESDVSQIGASVSLMELDVNAIESKIGR